MAPLMAQLAAIQGMRRDQIAARLRLRALRALAGTHPFSATTRRWTTSASTESVRGLDLRLPEVGGPDEAVAGAVERATAVVGGRFRFLNEERDGSLPVDWQATGAARLWRFHLHYFDDAPVLALAAGITGQSLFAERLDGLVADWIDRNPAGVGDGWHPYTLSRRIPNWIYALELGGRRRATADRVIASLEEQARYLSRHLEFDALGNHLLANARALLFAGAFFSGLEARRWWAAAEAILEREVREQFLLDGGHFERSPMYHALVLQDLLECAALYRRRGAVPDWLSHTLVAAENWLREMRHPDGGVALFNDCTLEGPSYPELSAFCSAVVGSPSHGASPGWRQLVWYPEGDASPDGPVRSLMASEEVPPPAVSLAAFSDSGYFTLRDAGAGHALFFDAGEPCPGYIPAHAHADLLSFELSLFGQRVIVDSGVCEYQAGPWRDYCRSTRAHNTVQVDGRDQSELWGSFRVGRRAHPVDVRWSAAAGCAEVTAAHTGYRRLRGEVTHRRTVSCQDSIFRIADEVTGSGRHRIESFLHFHPEMTVSLEAGGLHVTGQGIALAVRFTGDVAAWLLSENHAAPAALQGWYCPEFGVRRRGPVVVLSREGLLPARLGYEIRPLESGEAHPTP